jgi:large subunit ribosomal protein L21
MYAVFEDGSRQYRVSEGELVELDYRDVTAGSQIEFDRVLLIQGGEGTQVGRPYVAGARVVAEVVDFPSTKIYVQHFRRRKNYRRYKGHRQPYIAVKINHILLPGQDIPPPQSAQEQPTAPTVTEGSAAPEQTPTS